MDKSSTQRLQVFETGQPSAADPRRETTKMPSAAAIQALLDESVATSKRALEISEAHGSAIENLANGQIELTTKVDRIEKAVEERARKHSGGIQRVSSENEDQNAVLANVVTKLDELDKKTDAQTLILTEGKAAAKTLWNHPSTKWVVALALAYLAMIAKKHGVEIPVP